MRTEVEGRTLEYGLSDYWPDDTAPKVTVHFRWGAGGWLPVTLVASAAELCGDDPPLAPDQLDGLSDREWLRCRRWTPAEVASTVDESGFKWAIDKGNRHFWFVVQSPTSKRRARLPFGVVTFVLRDVATWSDLQRYAIALLRANGTSFPITRVTEILRRYDGKPRWKDASQASFLEEIGYVGFALSRVVASGRRSMVEEQMLEYGVTATWENDFTPKVKVYFRWEASGWCPTAAACAAVAECEEWDEDDDEAYGPPDNECSPEWKPSAVSRHADDGGFDWWIEERSDVFQLQVATGRHMASVPLNIARFVCNDSARSEIAQYAERLVRTNGPDWPISRVGAKLRETHGRPRRAAVASDGNDRRGPQSPATPKPTASTDAESSQLAAATTTQSVAEPRGVSTPESGEQTPADEARNTPLLDLASDAGSGCAPRQQSLTLASASAADQAGIRVQLENLRLLSQLGESGVLTSSEVEELKARILASDHDCTREKTVLTPNVETASTQDQSVPPAPQPTATGDERDRVCEVCGYAKNRRGSNRCVSCRREFSRDAAA
jgi:hypothetical protein